VSRLRSCGSLRLIKVIKLPMTFDPNFDLSKYQARYRPFADGLYHVRVIYKDYGDLDFELTFATEEEAWAAAVAIRDRDDRKAAVILAPSGKSLGVSFIQTAEDIDCLHPGDPSAQSPPPQTPVIVPAVDTPIMPGTQWVEPGTGTRVRKLAKAVNFGGHLPLRAGAIEAKKAVEELLRMVGPDYATRLRLTGEVLYEEDLKRLESLPDRTKGELNQRRQ
jgi:hypothetical protein